ncbi:MAG: pyroglutamyl-peptidase I [Pseudomonadota bacterium]
MTTILLTGFEPFGTTPINPAEKVAKFLDGDEIDGARVVSRIVPSAFFTCIDAVCAAIEEVRPETVVMMGEYGGRAMLTVERIAQNLNDGTRYKLADNKGRATQGEPTVPGGPAAYYTTLPMRAMVQAMRDAGIPSDISDVMGTFCCNHLMYGVMHHITVNRLDIRAGWIHLPHLPEVAALDDHLGLPSMSVETAAAGVRAGLAAIVTHAEDIDEPSLSRWQI